MLRPDPREDKKRSEMMGWETIPDSVEERIPFRCYALSLETKVTPTAGAKVGVSHEQNRNKIMCFENISLQVNIS